MVVTNQGHFQPHPLHSPALPETFFWEQPPEVTLPLQVKSAARFRGIKTTTGGVTRSLPLGQTPPGPSLSLLQELERLGYTQIPVAQGGMGMEGGESTSVSVLMPLTAHERLANRF